MATLCQILTGDVAACQNTFDMNVELNNLRVVAVDGGTATGKGRLIDELAKLLRLKGVPVIQISTGSLYRAVAVAGLQSVKVKNRPALDVVREMSGEQLIELANARKIEMHGGMVWIDGEAALVDEQLKAPGVGTGASIVGGRIEVRHMVDDIARRQINEFDGFVLIDGRDIGHGVVPDAPLKLLLTVAPEVAAARSSEHSLAEILERDNRDRNRPFGQLKHPDDPGVGVIVLPTDEHTPESVRDHVYALMEKIFRDLPPL